MEAGIALLSMWDIKCESSWEGEDGKMLDSRVVRRWVMVVGSMDGMDGGNMLWGEDLKFARTKECLNLLQEACFITLIS